MCPPTDSDSSDATPAGPPTPAALEAVIAEQQAQIAELLARIAEVERQLGLNSSNSGTEPVNNSDTARFGI